MADTSVIIEWDEAAVRAALPDETAISTITLAELAAGPHLTHDPTERARRVTRLQQVESLFDPVPFDRSAARSFGIIVAAVAAAGRSHRSRMADLMIAAVAHSAGLDLYTRNPDDFMGVDQLVSVVKA